MAALIPVIGACAQPGTELESEVAVSATRIDVPIRSPVWSGYEQALVGVTADQRIGTFDVLDEPGDRTTFSEVLPGVGRNILISPMDDSLVYVPQPGLGHVAVLSIEDLRPVATLSAGPAPALLAVNSGPKRLLALSADGSTVTPVDLHMSKASTPQHVDAGSSGHLSGTDRGRAVEYHVMSSGEIAHYKGTISPVQIKGEIDLHANASAGDPTKVTRFYVGERETGRLLAVDSKRGGHGLHVVGTASVGEPIRYLATDDKRIYVATGTKVAVFHTDTFEGYDAGRIEELQTFEFRSALPAQARLAPLSGLTVGPHQVFVTLQDQPYVVSVAKPNV